MLHNSRTTTTLLLRRHAAATATATTTLRSAGGQQYHRLAAAARLPSLTHAHSRKHLPATTITTQHQHRNIFNSLQKPPTGEVEKTQEEEEAYALAHPIDFDVASRIEGAETQIAVIDLEPGQILRAETGSLLYMTEGVEIQTNMGGGVSAGLKRWMTGQNLMVSDFKMKGPEGSVGTVALGTDFPSKILRVSLQEYGGALICQKGAFLAGTHNLNIEMEFTKSFKSGFFGGEGFVLQRLTGSGDAFIKAGGALIRRELREGEVLRVTSGSLVGFAPTVHYDVQMLSGIKNVVFGGEGLFLTTLTGPGTVYLQSMPPDRIISAIAARVPAGGGFGLGMPIGMGGGGGGEGGDGEGGGEGGGGGEERDSLSPAGAGAMGGSAGGFGGGGGEGGEGGGGNMAQEAQTDQRADDVWGEEKGNSGGGGEGGGEFEGEEAGEALSEGGVGEIARDIWGSIWDDDK